MNDQKPEWIEQTRTQMQTPPTDVVEAVQKIEDFLSKSDAPANRVTVEKEAFTMADRPGQGHDPHPTIAVTERDAIEARMAQIENEEAAKFDQWFASLSEAERQAQKPRESARGRAARLMGGNSEYKALASRLSALTTAGAPTKKMQKAEAPLSQGTVSDMVAAEVDKRAEELRKSEPGLSKEQARAKVWQRDRHLWERYDAHRGAAV